jgi:hypothetical protein
MVVVLTDSSNSSTGVVVPVGGDSSDDACSSNKSTTSTTPEKDPARNLTHAFEALCIDRDEAALKVPPSQAVISPTSVAELHNGLPTSPPGISSTSSISSHHHRGASPGAKATLGLTLHPDLQRELAQAQVNRVSFYSILHDINKEALAMAANDALSQVPDPAEEEHSPLVLAAGVVPATDHASVVSSKKEALIGMDLSVALVDEGTDASIGTLSLPEGVRAPVNSHQCLQIAAVRRAEEWLLSTIASRNDSSRPCPATFLQAIGEKEYENPVSSLAGGSRTQLWKPSRSWWEAKSGKNPWIEPTSHNKRWR